MNISKRQSVNDFSGEEYVAAYEDGKIGNSELLKLERITELLLEARASTRSEGTSEARHLVDVGCGNGSSTKVLAKNFDRTTAIDISPEQIMRAKELCSDHTIEFLVGNGEKMPVESGVVDAVTAILSAHNMDINKFTSECLRVLKPGGIAIFWGDIWGTICSMDGNVASQPDASYLAEEMNQELLEISRKHSHPNFYVMDCHKTLFNDITVTENKSLISGRIELVISLALMKKHMLSIPFWIDLGDKHPIHTFSKMLKELWNMEGVPDQDIKIRGSRKTFSIVIRK